MKGRNIGGGGHERGNQNTSQRGEESKIIQVGCMAQAAVIIWFVKMLMIM
jgi:hypothetical protein